MIVNLLLVLILGTVILIVGTIDEMQKDLRKVRKNLKYVKCRLDIIDDTIKEMYFTYSFDCNSLNKIQEELNGLKKPKIQQKWSKR